MRNDTQYEKDRLERSISQYKRDIDDPYVQDKWVEREALEDAQRYLDNLNKNRR